jgi:hypothetical protein
MVQIMSRCTDEPLLFPVVHCVSAIAKVAAASEPNFHEDQLDVIRHDQIDLSGADAVVALEGMEAATGQIGFRGAFRPPT